MNAQFYIFYSGILVPPKISPFSFGDEPLNNGETASVQCIISMGDLPVEIYWLMNGNLLSNDREDIHLSKNGKRISVLTIESITAQHAGNYSCLAENKAGSINYSTELFVIGKTTEFYVLISFTYVYVSYPFL